MFLSSGFSWRLTHSIDGVPTSTFKHQTYISKHLSVNLIVICSPCWFWNQNECDFIDVPNEKFLIPVTLAVSRTAYQNCKTQNSGLRFKEEKPRDPINQPSRCNTQEGLLSVEQMGDSDLLEGRAHRTANWASFLYAKTPYYQHITYGLQSDWLHVCKAILLAQLCGLLFKLKAILLVQTARAFVQT